MDMTMRSMAHVRATMNYTRDTGTDPEVYFYEPAPGTVYRSPGDDPSEVSIHDGWPNARGFSLDREGFSLSEFDSPFGRFENDEAIRREFYPQVTEFVRQHVGARRVFIFDHTIRSKANQEKQNAEHSTTQRAPVLLVHCDYTPASGPLRVRQLLPDEAESLLSRRVAFYNFWKPLKRRVEEMPLAMCDVTTMQEKDLLRMLLRYRDRTGEIYVMRRSDKHRWWYFPKMETRHALLLKTYDSETDGRARFMAHSAFQDPNTPPDAPVRESIEIRTIAFF